MRLFSCFLNMFRNPSQHQSYTNYEMVCLQSWAYKLVWRHASSWLNIPKNNKFTGIIYFIYLFKLQWALFQKNHGRWSTCSRIFSWLLLICSENKNCKWIGLNSHEEQGKGMHSKFQLILNLFPHFKLHVMAYTNF